MRDDWLSLSGEQRRRFTLELVRLYGWNCCLCGLPIRTQRELSVQHVLPRSKGGLTTFANCRPAHRRCNSAAGNRIVAGPASMIEDGRAYFARVCDRVAFFCASSWSIQPAPA